MPPQVSMSSVIRSNWNQLFRSTPPSLRILTNPAILYNVLILVKNSESLKSVINLSIFNNLTSKHSTGIFISEVNDYNRQSDLIIDLIILSILNLLRSLIRNQSPLVTSNHTLIVSNLFIFKTILLIINALSKTVFL